MGRFCDCCGYVRANERFGGKGRRARICSDCRKLPKAEQERILAIGEITGFMDQSNISKKNIARLRSLTSIDDSTFQVLRELILEIAELAPRKRRRWKHLSANRKDLLNRAIEAGFIEEYCESGETEDADFDPDESTHETASDDVAFSDMFSMSADSDDSDNELLWSEIPF